MTQEQSTFLEKLYAEQVEQLVIYAYRFVWDWEDARVVTQEAFLTGIVKFEEFTKENPVGWLKTTIRNLASNMNRAKKIRKDRLVSLDDANIQNAVYDQQEGLKSIIAQCTEILSPEEFALFEATILAGEPSSKVYKEFGLSYEACRKRVYRILEKLRKNWKD